MNNQLKITLLSLIRFGIFVLFWVILNLTTTLPNPYIAIIAALLMFVLSPRFKTHDTQSGQVTIIRWFLLKKPIRIDRN